MESQINMESDFRLLPENTSIRDTDPGETSSGPDHVDPQQPAKKATRQWAAWTRQEEESFFTALRQVGKNFEKITCRVQSKNKDQVRHYYYRLVRRMNKLLGPGLCLDAKNTKDTNAAMLRWWSLLEKYSCKASKLHLKPRRFKIFVGALENQLLRDRKKNVRKRSVQGQNGPSTAPNSLSNHDKASGNDTRTVKLVLVDSQNVQKLGAGKGSLKRNVKIGVIRGNNKGESTATKPSRQRRKQGTSSSAYKKWEKAAIAGVSLVADAAEHLERTATDKEIEYHQEQTNLSPSAQHQYVESNAQANMKLKLQLFPIDDATRRALEMDKHNPYLELTLSTRKKISSVLEHLNRKWGSSRLASGELMLFPYGIHADNLVAYQRWTQDSAISAADVYTLIGSPSVFRLRYGWFLSSELKSPAPSASTGIPSGDEVGVENGKEKSVDTVFVSRPSTNDQSRKLAVEDQLTTNDQNHASAMASTSVPVEMSHHSVAVCLSYPVESYVPATNISCQRKETNTKQLGDVDAMRLSNGNELSAGEWADSLTNISVGDLLSEVPHDGDADCIQLRAAESGHCLQQIPFSCDSFDAAIAAHLLKQQNKMENLPAVQSHPSSIWDAEETCDAFSFQKNHVFHQEVPASCSIVSAVGGKHTGRESSPEPFTFVEELSDAKRPVDDPADGDPMDECPSDPQVLDNSAKDFTGLTDLYWPDSLGPLDLDIPPSKYHNEGLILSDSLSGLNRLIASSLDAFQSCSFMGMDKKDLTSAVEARETPSFSDYKIGSRV